MPLKLNSAGGGSVTIDTPSTASNFNLTVPATSGSVAVADGAGNQSVAGNLSFNSGFGSAGVAYGCRAWVNFNGTGTVAIRASGNVSSITDNATGNYRVNFITSMPDTNYGVNVTIGSTSTDSVWPFFYIPNVSNGGAPTTTSCGINTGQASQTDFDPFRVNVAIFR